jgi:hypothetical protein
MTWRIRWLEGNKMVALLISAILLGWLAYVFIGAPEGYEAADGFHLGHPFRIRSHQDKGTVLRARPGITDANRS